MCLTLQAAASGLWLPVIRELYMRALGALCSESCVLKSADDEKERARADASDAATPLPYLECGMYLCPDHLCSLLFRIILHLLCLTEMLYDVWWFYSRKWSNKTETLLLLGCLQTKSAALCSVVVLLWWFCSLLGKVVLVKIKKVIWWSQERMWW